MKTLLFATLIGAVLLTGCQSAPAPQGDVSSDGKHLFEENCAVCHGITGHGNAVHFDDPTFQKLLTDTQIQQTIRNGKGNMPAFGTTFTSAQINSLVKYLRSLAHPQ